MTRDTNYATAALLAIAVAAAATDARAEQEFVGDLAIYGGNLVMFDDADGDHFSNGRIAGANVRLQYGMLQLDLNSEGVDTGNGDRYTAQGAALHFIAPLEQATVGAMVSAGTDGPGDVTVGGAPYATFAIEGATSVGNTLVDAQLGRFVPKDDSYIENGYYLYVGTATPLSDKLTLKLNASLVRMADVDTTDYTYLQGYTYGAFVEYAAMENAVLFAGLTGNHLAEPSESEKWNVASVAVGVRIPLGNAAANKLVFADHNPLTGVNHARINDWQ